MSDKEKCMIYKSETTTTIDKVVVKELTVKGDTLKEVEKVFDKKWLTK